MRAGIIADILSGQMSGMARYIMSVIEELTHGKTGGKIDLISISKQVLPEERASLFQSHITLPNYQYPNLVTQLVSYAWRYPRVLNDKELDVVHCPTQGVPPYFWFINARKVVTIHGAAAFELSPEIHPQPTLRHKLPYALFEKRIQAVIAVSNSAKRNIARHYRIDPDKIYVIFHGVDHSKFHLPNENLESIRRELAEKLDVSSPFLLHVSNYQPKKNVVGIVKAFKKVIENSRQDLKLVLVGGIYHGFTAVQSLIEELGLKSHIVHVGHVPNEELLAKLYMGAELFLFPSLHESFGLPILEAMACGTPVITSNIYSMPEVAGDAAVLVNPYDIDEIAEAILELLSNQQKRGRLIQKGLEKAKQFTWEKSAREHLELYKRVVET